MDSDDKPHRLPHPASDELTPADYYHPDPDTNRDRLIDTHRDPFTDPDALTHTHDHWHTFPHPYGGTAAEHAHAHTHPSFQPDPQPKPDPGLFAVASAIASLNVASIHFDAIDRFPGDGYECRIKDADSRVIATFNGKLDLDTKDVSAFDYTVTAVRRGHELLPVRAQPQPKSHAHPFSFPHPQPDPPDPDNPSQSFVHTHRHHHRANPNTGEYLAGSGFVIYSYSHDHSHAHDPGRIPDDRSYHTDHAH
jgi:hypothetical protein